MGTGASRLAGGSAWHRLEKRGHGGHTKVLVQMETVSNSGIKEGLLKKSTLERG